MRNLVPLVLLAVLLGCGSAPVAETKPKAKKKPVEAKATAQKKPNEVSSTLVNKPSVKEEEGEGIIATANPQLANEDVKRPFDPSAVRTEDPEEKPATAPQSVGLVLGSGPNRLPERPNDKATVIQVTPEEQCDDADRMRDKDSKVIKKYEGVWLEMEGFVKYLGTVRAQNGQWAHYVSIGPDKPFGTKVAICLIDPEPWKRMQHGDKVHVRGVAASFGAVCHCTINVPEGTACPELTAEEIAKQFKADPSQLKKYDDKYVVVSGKLANDIDDQGDSAFESVEGVPLQIKGKVSAWRDSLRGLKAGETVHLLGKLEGFMDETITLGDAIRTDFPEYTLYKK